MRSTLWAFFWVIREHFENVNIPFPSDLRIFWCQMRNWKEKSFFFVAFLPTKSFLSRKKRRWITKYFKENYIVGIDISWKI